MNWGTGFPASHGRLVVRPGLQQRWAMVQAPQVQPITMTIGAHRGHGDMAHRNAVGIAEYANETAKIIRSGVPVPAWVSHKLSQARRDLSDVKHHLEYPHHHRSLNIGRARSRRRRRGLLARLFGWL